LRGANSWGRALRLGDRGVDAGHGGGGQEGELTRAVGKVEGNTSARGSGSVGKGASRFDVRGKGKYSV